jgi:1-acyl-sn-glycerol-3-phosphate acyltransferase
VSGPSGQSGERAGNGERAGEQTGNGEQATGQSELLTDSTLTYRVGRGLCALACRAFLRPRFEGLEHLPAEGGALIASNHQSYLDIPLVAISTARHVCFVARDSLADSKALGWLMRRSGAVLIRRGKPDRAALREMVAHLEGGDLVSVFPEGTRSTDGAVAAFRGGAMLAARLARVPIVPAGIRGTLAAWPKGRGPRPAPVSIAFGPPVDGALPDAADLVRARVLALVGDGRDPRS